jgi:hypothetical protein
VAAVSPLAPGRTGFTTLDSTRTGLRFTNTLSRARMARNSSLMGGSGVALGDVDGDGWCDVYLCGLEGPNALFRNLGDWRFVEIAAAAGVACEGSLSRGAAFADLDGDGDPDLLVTTNGGGTRCFTNDGRGSFTEATEAAGTAARTGSTSLALADVDQDADLDLYVVNFGVNSVLRDGGAISVREVGGQLTVMGRHANRLKFVDGVLVEYGEPDAMFLNDGRGRFRPLPAEPGWLQDETGQPMRLPWDFGMAAQWHDLNGDGRPDLYVCNDFHTPDRIWINLGEGRFRAIAPEAVRKLSTAAMGLDGADLDRDGHPDIVVVEMLSRDPARRLRQMTPDAPTAPHPGRWADRPQTGRNTLLWNRGDGTFAEIACFAGIAASDWSWMPACLDVDLDGFEDILVVNGHAYDLMDLDTTARERVADARSAGIKPWDFPRFVTPNCAFRNRGDLTFEEVGERWGFDATSDCNGLAFGDLDNDGDLDVVLNCLNAPALLLRNESAAPRLLVRLRGRPPNTQGIGAVLTVRVPGLPPQSQTFLAGGRYQSADEPARLFAAGHPTNLAALEVRWPSGRRDVVTNVPVNHLVDLHELGRLDPLAPPPPPPPWFADHSRDLNHRHQETPYDDLGRQPLLPRRLSQLGPGVAWFDVDGDGRDELFIGAGAGGALAAYAIRKDGRFESLPTRIPKAWQGAPQTGLAGLTLAPGQPALLAGVSGYEHTNWLPTAALVFTPGRADPGGLEATAVLDNPLAASVGPLAVADLDGDGDLDVFVGGRVVPGRYPVAAGGAVFRNEAGALRFDAEASRDLAEAGMISGAGFSDLTGDGLPELVLACDWGPLQVWRNHQGRLVPWDVALRPATPDGATSLSRLTGWWQSVAAADFDGDGRLDLVAGNWGRNSPWQPAPGRPLRLWYGDFDEDAVIDLVDAEWSTAANRWLPRVRWSRLTAALPGLAAAFPSNAAYADAGVEGILGVHAASARLVEAAELSSIVLLNRGDAFERVTLPREAQLAPVFGITPGDFDGDGVDDLFLAQNFFGLPTAAGRQDGGRGLLLRGEGQGRFSAVPGQVSGLLIYGEQRGSATADYDHDGRLDLCVAQNGGETKLYRNTHARPGIRVRLAGPPANPGGVGAQIRWRAGDEWGPTRELHAGAGYWSQNSLITTIPAHRHPTHLWVRWPGGGVTETPVPPGTTEVTARPAGSALKN